MAASLRCPTDDQPIGRLFCRPLMPDPNVPLLTVHLSDPLQPTSCMTPPAPPRFLIHILLHQPPHHHHTARSTPLLHTPKSRHATTVSPASSFPPSFFLVHLEPSGIYVTVVTSHFMPSALRRDVINTSRVNRFLALFVTRDYQTCVGYICLTNISSTLFSLPAVVDVVSFFRISFIPMGFFPFIS